MSSTYFTIPKCVSFKTPKKGEYTEKYELRLNTLAGKYQVLQMTVITESPLPSQSGIAYICLTRAEIECLIVALRAATLPRE